MRLILLFGALIFSLLGHAQAVQPANYAIHQEYISTRAAGMGNAFTAVADDFSAIFYNPAMLAWRTSGTLHAFVRAGASADGIKLFNQIKDVKKEASTDQVQGYSNMIDGDLGDDFYYRVPTIGAAYVRPNWGIALIPADLSLDASAHRELGPAINVSLYEDTTLASSYAHELNWFGKDHKLSWGITGKAVYRVYVGDSISAASLAGGQSITGTIGADEGMTVDADVGTSWKPPVPQTGFFSFLKYAEPSFAIVGRNLLDYGFKKDYHFISKTSGQPPNLERRFDFGSKWDLPKLWVFDPHFSADIRDVGDSNWTFKKGYHVGAELYWTMYNWWKGHWSVGVNQGYLCAGFGARMAIFQIDLATYGEEVGTDEAPQESRRYMVEAALDF